MSGLKELFLEYHEIEQDKLKKEEVMYKKYGVEFDSFRFYCPIIEVFNNIHHIAKVLNIELTIIKRNAYSHRVSFILDGIKYFEDVDSDVMKERGLI